MTESGALMQSSSDSTSQTSFRHLGGENRSPRNMSIFEGQSFSFLKPRLKLLLLPTASFLYR